MSFACGESNDYELLPISSSCIASENQSETDVRPTNPTNYFTSKRANLLQSSYSAHISWNLHVIRLSIKAVLIIVTKLATNVNVLPTF
jgi:hypothetical protein